MAEFSLQLNFLNLSRAFMFHLTVFLDLFDFLEEVSNILWLFLFFLALVAIRLLLLLWISLGLFFPLYLALVISILIIFLGFWVLLKFLAVTLMFLEKVVQKKLK